MSEKIQIRLGEKRDTLTIAMFNVALAQETEQIELTKDIVFKGVLNLLDHPQYGFYVVAQRERDDIIMGSLMITYEWSDWRNGVLWWVQSVFVRPEYRRQGVLKKLFTFLREKAQQQDNVCGFRLYVEQNNQNALVGYERVGMNKTGYYMYEDFFDQPSTPIGHNI